LSAYQTFNNLVEVLGKWMAVFSDVQFTPNVTVQALADSIAKLMLSQPKGIMILCSAEAASWGDDFKQ
jgi:hypothetical protein